MKCVTYIYPQPSTFSASLPTCAHSTPTPPCAVRQVPMRTLPLRTPIATGPHSSAPRCFPYDVIVAVESARPVLALHCAYPIHTASNRNGFNSRCNELLSVRRPVVCAPNYPPCAMKTLNPRPPIAPMSHIAAQRRILRAVAVASARNDRAFRSAHPSRPDPQSKQGKITLPAPPSEPRRRHFSAYRAPLVLCAPYLSASNRNKLTSSFDASPSAHRRRRVTAYLACLV